MSKRLRSIIESNWINVPGPKYGKLPSLNRGEFWSFNGIEEVPVKDIHTIQHLVTREGVDKYNSGSLKKPARIYIHHDGNAYLQDGHHQYTGAVESGKETIPAEVWRPKQ